MENALLPDGFKLLIAGQLTVLAFLGCIVLTIKVIAWVVGKSQPPAALPKAPAAAPAEEDDEVAAVIAAALHHRERE